MIEVKDPPDHATQTCEIRLKDRGLPDESRLRDHIASMSVGASLRSMEITAHGRLVRAGESLLLQLNQGERVALAPLTSKIQWDLKRKRPQGAARRELTAFQKLKEQKVRSSGLLEITGPVRTNAEGSVSLEVRMFLRIPSKL